jgi:hypothetical protein
VGELVGGVLERFFEGDTLGTRHERTKVDGQRIAVGQALVIGFGEEKLASAAASAGLLSASCSTASSRRKRRRRTAVWASARAETGGEGHQLRKSSKSDYSPGGGASLTAELSMSP